MSTQPFDHRNAATIRAARSPRLSHRANFTGPFLRVRAFNLKALRQETAWPPAAVTDVRALARGVSWAFAIEGGMALLIYAAWYVWHLCW
jgi:hypothetical protein